MLGLELGSTLGMSEFIKVGDRVGLPVPLGESLGCKLGSSDGIALSISVPVKLGLHLKYTRSM
jgi:hypothetical protein